MLTARDFLVFCWGAILASGIWACCWWGDAVRIGPGNAPVLLWLATFLTLASVAAWVTPLIAEVKRTLKE